MNFSFSIDLNLHVIQSSNFSTSYSHSTLIEHLIPCARLPSPYQMHPQAPQHNRFQAELTISHAHFMPRPSPHYSRKALTHIFPFAQTENLGIIPGCSFSLILHQWLTSTCEWGRASLVAQMVKNPPAIRETWVLPLSWEDPLEEGMTTHSSILVWRIPWTEEPGGLQSMGHKESDTTEQLGTAQWVRRASKSFHPCLSPSPSSGPPHLSSKLWDHLITVSLSLFFYLWSSLWSEVKWKSLSLVWLFTTPWTIVYEILQARILEWVAFLFSRGSPQPRDQTQVPRIPVRSFTRSVTRKAQEYWSG